MVEDKIIIHEKKSNYLLLLIGFSLVLLSVTMSLGYYFINLVGISIFQADLTSDFLSFNSNFSNVIAVFSWCLNLAGTIIFFIAGRKILVEKKFSTLVFVLLMVSSFLNLIAAIASSVLTVYWIFIVISFLVKLVALVFMILILVRNKILSKLLLTSVILFGIHILIKVVTPYVREVILSLRFASYQPFDIGKMLATLNAVSLISRLVGFAAIVLVTIYLIKAFIKNNVFNKQSLNKVISILLMVVPTLVVNTIVCVIYFVCLFLLTTI